MSKTTYILCRCAEHRPLILPLLGTNLSESLNIQKREIPSAGPSFMNSWPSPFPHFPHRTCKYQQYTLQWQRNKEPCLCCLCHLEGCESLHHFGDTVLSDGFCESWPRRRVWELGTTGEQWMVALGAHINTYGAGVIIIIIYMEKKYGVFFPHNEIFYFT